MASLEPSMIRNLEYLHNKAIIFGNFNRAVGLGLTLVLGSGSRLYCGDANNSSNDFIY